MWGILAETLSGYLPEQAAMLHLSFALADAARLELMFSRGRLFRIFWVRKETREAIVDSFDEYWAPIEGRDRADAAKRTLPFQHRAGELFEPKFTIASQKFQSKGALQIERREMLIGAGRALKACRGRVAATRLVAISTLSSAAHPAPQ